MCRCFGIDIGPEGRDRDRSDELWHAVRRASPEEQILKFGTRELLADLSNKAVQGAGEAPGLLVLEGSAVEAVSPHGEVAQGVTSGFFFEEQALEVLVDDDEVGGRGDGLVQLKPDSVRDHDMFLSPVG